MGEILKSIKTYIKTAPLQTGCTMKPIEREGYDITRSIEQLTNLHSFALLHSATPKLHNAGIL